MSVIVDARRLRWELARRGWAASDLAARAKLSQATVGAALSGRPISAGSLDLMAEALANTPASEVISLLIGDEERDLLAGSHGQL